MAAWPRQKSTSDSPPPTVARRSSLFRFGVLDHEFLQAFRFGEPYSAVTAFHPCSVSLSGIAQACRAPSVRHFPS